jgi:hypothetical protein
MNCAEFQKVLPYIIESGGNAEEEEHLRNCQVCSDLVADLKYIAEQAKLLVPMEDPSPKVWEGIRGALEREDLIRPVRSARRGLLRRSGFAPWILALAALAIAITWHFARGKHPNTALQTIAPVTSAVHASPVDPLAPSDADDQLVLSALETANPSLRAIYAAALRQINQAIAEAEESLRQHPGNPEIRQFLLTAYHHKAMWYTMAVQSLH